mmetsp:Transcript_60974/g.172384  ORF Transcript_60974/g.172384 Transcript_60974/m.172384 type:complete len:122 (-) Transcript_60974:219-584(-)
MAWGGKGKGGFTPVFMPMWGKDSWGKGKGKSKHSHKNFHAEKKVWIGGIPEEVNYKELHEHMKPAGTKWVEVFQGNGKGTGVACFGTQEEATAAIAALNGSVCGSGTLEVDVWEKKPKEAA